MNTLKISNKPIPTTCHIPTSKSYSNRALVKAALSKQNMRIKHISTAQDVVDFINCLRGIGISIEMDGMDCVVKGNFPECELDREEIHLFAGQGGTTSRFLMALVALGKKKYIIDVDEQLKVRPIQPLISSLKSIGVKIRSLEKSPFPIEIQGPIIPGTFVEVDCSQSTQFASALMLVSQVADINVNLVNKNFSLPYVNMTLEVLDKKGSTLKVPIDFSCASYVIAYASLNQNCRILNVDEIDKLQADSSLVQLLNNNGARILLNNGDLVIEKADTISAFYFNAVNSPDLVPTLVYLAMFAEGTSEIKNVRVLKHKETDRLAWIQKILKDFDCPYRYDAVSDILTIDGQQDLLIPSILEVPDDHRIVMMGSLILKQLGGGVITNPDAVKKSFKNFFEIF